ncbi:hypothetical protein N9396_03925 [Candidatus Pelagibacter ubique]|jgi:hypothetical protein|nr:hypothetical protein [Candidatus Pelagibacter bacterium]MDB3968899.1 hypothetical protein [Candidatus Pelagibacter ubique]
MKNLFAKIFIILILLQGCDSASVPVKKSKTNICHKKGSKYYDQTKYFRAYQTMKDCIESGGRLPKRS